MSKTVVADGHFSVTVTTPDGKTENWDRANRKVEIVDGKTVVRRNPDMHDESITVLPEGTQVRVNK